MKKIFTSVLMGLLFIGGQANATSLITCNLAGTVSREAVRLNSVTALLAATPTPQTPYQTVEVFSDLDQASGTQVLNVKQDGMLISHSFHDKTFADRFNKTRRLSSNNQDQNKEYIQLRNLDISVGTGDLSNSFLIQLDPNNKNQGNLYLVNAECGGNQGSSCGEEKWYAYECSIKW